MQSQSWLCRMIYDGFIIMVISLRTLSLAAALLMREALAVRSLIASDQGHELLQISWQKIDLATHDCFYEMSAFIAANVNQPEYWDTS